jgi:bacteriocin-like protein
MNTKSVHAGRELTADELNAVSGGKGLEGRDRLGNFEIQNLMSRYNQAETLASSVQKKADDTASAVIGKI